jgi:hypothetical protein
VIKQALDDLAVPTERLSLDAGLRYLTSVAEAKNETLFFVAEAYLPFDYEAVGSAPAHEIIPPRFLDEAFRLRSMVVVAHRNPLDVMLCRTNDCFTENTTVMEPTFLNGSFAPLCFHRRTAIERTYLRVHDFDALKAKLRELASMPEIITQFLMARGFGEDGPIPTVRVEDLAAFQYEETPGLLRELSISTWGVLLKGFNIRYSTGLLQSQMDEIIETNGVRRDLLYSERFWVPPREEDGLLQMRAEVEALVDEFGFKRTPSTKLVDWTIEQTFLLSKQMASSPKHGLLG